MRGGLRTRHAEEEESVFISMTDLTVSFLFIIMILLAFFATQIAPKDMVPRDEYEKTLNDLRERDKQVSSLLEELAVYRANGGQSLLWLISERQRLQAELDRVRNAMGLGIGANVPEEAAHLRDEINRLHRLLEAARESNPIERYNFRVAELRGKLLEHIKTRIKDVDPSIDVEISRNRDALEFKGDGLFPSSSDIPTSVGKHKMEVIAGVLKQNVGCFALSEQSVLEESCNPALALIDSLQVEGHTDDTGPDILNMDLSSRRGTSIYAIMATAASDLLGFRNLRGQPVLSVAGYGEGRPIAANDTIQGRDGNRRIDLRFIMFSPTEEKFVPQKLEDLPRVMRLLSVGPTP